MNKNNQMLIALESHYKHLMDRHALDIGNFMSETDSSSLDELISSIEKYCHVLDQFNFVQRLKIQNNETEPGGTNDENENHSDNS